MRSDLIKDISAEKLNRISRHISIYCIGCGKRFIDMINNYKNELFIDRIVALLDNNSKLWGNEIKINDTIFKIESPRKLEAPPLHSTILLITSDRYAEIYDSIKKYLNKRICVYKYPQTYYGWIGAVMKIIGFFPDKHQLMFRSWDEPHENADEIVDFMSKEPTGKKYKFVYLCDSIIKRNDNIKYICYSTIICKERLNKVLDFCITYARSKYLLYENAPIKKCSKKQKLCFLGHGTIPLKDVSDVLKQSGELDYAMCPGKGCTEIYFDQYGVPAEKLIYMMPARVYRMLRGSEGIGKLGNFNARKYILWLPTFRQLAGSFRSDSLNSDPLNLLNENTEMIDDELSKNGIVLLIKLHPRAKETVCLRKNLKSIVLIDENSLTDHELILHDLLRDADGLLTDYSGISFEYMLLDRPIGYVINDIGDYNRGFAYKNYLDYMPGTLIRKQEDLMSFFQMVSHGDDDNSKERRELVRKLFGDKPYDNGAQKLMDFIEKENRS